MVTIAKATGYDIESKKDLPVERRPVETHRHAREDCRVRDQLHQLFRFGGQHIFRVCFEAQDKLAFPLSLRNTGRRECRRFGVGNTPINSSSGVDLLDSN